MADITDMHADSDCLCVTLAGMVNPSNAESLLVAIRNQADQSGLYRVLIDASDVEGKIEMMTRLDLADIMSKCTGELQIAFVLSDTLFESGMLAESVAVARGIRARAFTDLRQARKWIKAPSND